MSGAVLLVAFIIVVALAFDYINGFHDAANSIATIVSTRVLTPMQAVAWAAFFNFVAAFGLWPGGRGEPDEPHSFACPQRSESAVPCRARLRALHHSTPIGTTDSTMTTATTMWMCRSMFGMVCPRR